MKFYMPFAKVEAQDDGTVKVSGIASTEAVDAHGEIVKADAMRAAIPDYMSFGGTGALREMHQAIAAGTVLKAEVNASGETHIEAHVVDANSAKKVIAGVFKGFSIGGKVTEKDGNVIKGLSLREISLVDRPANPDAKMSLMKVEDGEDIAKSLYTTARLAELLASLKSLESSESYESDSETSPVSPAIKAACKALSTALMASASKETSKADGADDLEKADMNTDLKKLADTTEARLAKVDEVMKSTSDAVAVIAKAIEGLPATLEKQSGDMAKAMESVAATAKEQGDLIKGLTDRLDKVEKSPAAPKAIVRALGKSFDTGGKEEASDDDIAKALAGMTPDQRTQAVMKAALANGVTI